MQRGLSDEHLSVRPSVKCVNVTKPKHLAKKSSIMTNRKSPTSFPMSLRWTAYVVLESKKSLNYSMQHCCQPFGPCVQTDINVTGLMVKGPRVSICPRAPDRSVTPLVSMTQTLQRNDITLLQLNKTGARQLTEEHIIHIKINYIIYNTHIQ